VSIPDANGVRFAFYSAIGRLFQSVGAADRARDALRAAIDEARRRDEDLPWVFLRLAEVCDVLGDAEGRRRALEGALSADATRLVSDATLRARVLLGR
jgi:hypothetical protein